MYRTGENKTLVTPSFSQTSNVRMEQSALVAPLPVLPPVDGRRHQPLSNPHTAYMTQTKGRLIICGLRLRIKERFICLLSTGYRQGCTVTYPLDCIAYLLVPIVLIGLSSSSKKSFGKEPVFAAVNRDSCAETCNRFLSRTYWSVSERGWPLNKPRT